MDSINEYLLAFLLCAVLIYFMRPRAIRLGLVDVPDERKLHRGNIPLIGGLAIYGAFGFSCISAQVPTTQLLALFGAGLLLVITGLFDDWRELSARLRFAAQISAALLLSVWGGVALRDMGALALDGSVFTLGVMALPVTVFATVGVINAINMSDGMDGLSGSLVLVAITGLAVVAWQSHDHGNFESLLLLASTLLAFLAFNIRVGKKRASVFLGDAGAMFLGLALVWYVIGFSQGPTRLMAPVTALWLLLVPLFDTVGVMLRRLLLKRSPFNADREHLHHVLLAAGFTVNQSLAIMLVIAMIAMGAGLAGHFYHFAELTMFLAFLGLFAVYFCGLMHCWHTGRLLHKKLNPYLVERRELSDRRQELQTSRWIRRNRRVLAHDRRLAGVDAAHQPPVLRQISKN